MTRLVWAVVSVLALLLGVNYLRGCTGFERLGSGNIFNSRNQAPTRTVGYSREATQNEPSYQPNPSPSPEPSEIDSVPLGTNNDPYNQPDNSSEPVNGAW
jgi:hypothetical protein